MTCRFCKKEGEKFIVSSKIKRIGREYVYYKCKECNANQMRDYRIKKKEPKIEPVSRETLKSVTYETHQERVRRLKAALLVPRTTIQAEPETPKEELPIDDFRYDSSEFKRINPNKVDVKTMFDEFGNAIDPGTDKIYE